MSVSYQAMRGLANLPWFYSLGGLELLHTNNLDTSANAVTVTSSATIHTKGSWAELVASTAGESGLLTLHFSGVGTSATETSMLVDVGVGASGSESIIAENIAVGGASAAANGILVCLPVRIASGSRIACRIQALIASDTVAVRYGVYKTTAMQVLPSTVDVIGTDTATSRGTAMSGVSGTWVQATASTSRRYRAVYLVPSIVGTNLNTTRIIYDVGFGASGSEVKLGTTAVQAVSTEDVRTYPHLINLPIACDVPAGSRLAVRHDLATGPSGYSVCLVGIP